MNRKIATGRSFSSVRCKRLSETLWRSTSLNRSIHEVVRKQTRQRIHRLMDTHIYRTSANLTSIIHSRLVDWQLRAQTFHRPALRLRTT